MNLSEHRAGDAITFTLDGDFTFRDHTTFDHCRVIIESGEIASAHFDLSAVRNVQTTAVGMLLLLADAAEKQNVRLSMKPPTGPARRLLALCRIDKAYPLAP